MESALIDQTCEQYLGQWKRLVSTTNWEKGQIIHHWRLALVAAEVPAAEYSDEAWSRRVGNVTPQHVGRLRRAYERFAAVREAYAGLYWSHFQAALDWDDAEMWLEGAVQNDWSISEMRGQRSEVRGALAGESATEPAEEEAPWDDDAEASEHSDQAVQGSMSVAHAPDRQDRESDEDDDSEQSEYDVRAEDEQSEAEHATMEAPAVRPFAALPPLPPDVNDAFEAYKLAILRHKLAGWQEISRDDLIASLDGLKQLALVPAEV